MTTNDTRTQHVILTRGLIAIAWSAVFAAASHSLTTGVSVAAGILLVIYPLIDVVGTLLDAGSASPSLMPLVIYTATGGAEFVIQAGLLVRRRHQMAIPAL
jgi:hypothetical protein